MIHISIIFHRFLFWEMRTYTQIEEHLKQVVVLIRKYLSRDSFADHFPFLQQILFFIRNLSCLALGLSWAYSPFVIPKRKISYQTLSLHSLFESVVSFLCFPLLCSWLVLLFWQEWSHGLKTRFLAMMKQQQVIFENSILSRDLLKQSKNLTRHVHH